MSKKNRSVSVEDLQNTSGGVILELPRANDHPIYVLLDDENKPVSVPVNSLAAARALADELGIQDQQVITSEHIRDYLGEVYLKKMMNKFYENKKDN